MAIPTTARTLKTLQSALIRPAAIHQPEEIDHNTGYARDLLGSAGGTRSCGLQIAGTAWSSHHHVRVFHGCRLLTSARSASHFFDLKAVLASLRQSALRNDMFASA